MPPEPTKAPDPTAPKLHRRSSISRPAPHDPDAEREVLGAALSSSSRWPRPDLAPDDFWVPAHRDLWELIPALAEPIRPVDLPEPVREPARLAVTAWTGVDPAIPADRIRRHSAARRAIALAHELTEAAYLVDVDQAAHLAHRLAEDLDAA